MSDFKVGQHITVKLSGGRLVDAEIKAIIDTPSSLNFIIKINSRFFQRIARATQDNLSKLAELKKSCIGPICRRK